MSDGELRYFGAVMGTAIAASLTPFGFANGDLGPLAVILPFSAVIAAPGLTRLAFTRYRPRGRRPRDTSAPMKALARFAGLTMLSCGCTGYEPSIGRDTFPGGDPLETDTVYVERRNGARVHIDRYDKRLVRCHRCGKHRYTYDRDRARVRVAFEDDPDRYPSDAEIEGGDVPVIPETEVEA